MSPLLILISPAISALKSYRASTYSLSPSSPCLLTWGTTLEDTGIREARGEEGREPFDDAEMLPMICGGAAHLGSTRSGVGGGIAGGSPEDEESPAGRIVFKLEFLRIMEALSGVLDLSAAARSRDLRKW